MKTLGLTRAITFAAVLCAAGVRAAEPLKIAFVDTGDTGRAVAAEALADAEIRREHLPIVVISRAVDLDPFEVRPEPEVVRLLARRGINVRAHRASQLSDNVVGHADLVLTMTAGHRAAIVARYPDAARKTFTLSAYATGQEADVADAKDRPPAAYAAMVNQVARLTPLALAKAWRLEEHVPKAAITHLATPGLGPGT